MGMGTSGRACQASLASTLRSLFMAQKKKQCVSQLIGLVDSSSMQSQ